VAYFKGLKATPVSISGLRARFKPGTSEYKDHAEKRVLQPQKDEDFGLWPCGTRLFVHGNERIFNFHPLQSFILQPRLKRLID